MTGRSSLDGGWTAMRDSDCNCLAANTAASDLINILDAVEVPIVVMQSDLAIGCFNRAASSALGLSPADIGRTSREVSAFAGWPRLDQLCSDVATGGVESRVDFQHGDKSFVVRIAPKVRPDGRVTETVLTFTNVTAFRGSLDHAIYEREFTKTIFNTVDDPLVVMAADQRVLSANRAFYTMFGISRDEARESPLSELGNGTLDSAAFRMQFEELLAGSQQFEPVEIDNVATARGPRVLVIDAHPLFLPGHSERRVLVTFHDITARKLAEDAKDQRSEEELRRSEAFLAEGQRLSLTGTFCWKLATDEVAWSEQLYRIYEFDSAVPATLELIYVGVHPEDLSSVEGMLRQARDFTDDFECQYRLTMADNSLKYLHVVAHASWSNDGQLEYIVAVQDVTARRVSEEALERARSELAKFARVTSLGVLTASIAHEVNQPLSGIITNAGSCLRMLDADPPNLDGARETVRRTIRDGNRAADVITHLRALYSNEDLSLEFLNLNEIIREVIALSSSDLQRNRIALQQEFSQELPTVCGDRIQLQQVILNLLRNACEAMIDVDDRQRLLRIQTDRHDPDRVRVSVSDVGVGVAPQSLHKVLDAFYTTKEEGMGVGLSVSRSIIERHHGRLWVEANEGPGATFSFSVPCDQSNATGVEPG
ncbi:MAG: ATP-binding protein [Ilumatobacteraceae bacterium]